MIVDLWSQLSGRFLMNACLVVCSILSFVYWPVGKSSQVQLCLLLGIGILLQILVWNIPVSDDVNRYFWEGRLVMYGENPYEVPANDISRVVWHDDIYEGMNHKKETTVYPPLSQWVFAAATMVWEDLRVFKLLSWIFVLGCIPLLQSLLGANHEATRWLPVFVMNPVNVFSFAGEGHFDSLMVFFILLAVWLVRKDKRILAISAILVAINLKIVALLVAPYFLWRVKWSDWWKVSVTGFVVLLLPSLPFLDASVQMVEGILRFGGDFTGNASLHELLSHVAGSSRVAGVVGLFLLCVLVLFLFFKKPALEVAIFVSFGVLLLVAPLVTFWYVSWMLPFAALLGRMAAPAWWLSATVIAYYAAWGNRESGGEWMHPLWASLLQWLPVYGLLIWMVIRRSGVLPFKDSPSV